jgi:tetratricopeptide (TPR) repeat protein
MNGALRTTALCALLAMAALCERAAAQDAADVLAAARPAVVTIVARDKHGVARGQGSGFIVRSDGVIVTAWHVVKGAAFARVRLPGGASYGVAGVIAKDVDKDFAVLKVSANNLPFVELGDSDAVRQGDRVLTLGSPLGLDQSASEGIVSAVRKGGGLTFLQITAPVSAGNSGGPVLNAAGQVVGIVEFRIKEGQALNFAVGINCVKEAVSATNQPVPLNAAARSGEQGRVRGKAVAAPRRAATLAHYSAPYLWRAGRVAYDSGRWDEAYSFFMAAVAKRPGWACEGYFRAGICLEHRNFDETTRPGELQNLCNIPVASADAVVGRSHEAIRLLEKSLSSALPVMWRRSAYQALGDCYRRLHRHAEAGQAYYHAIGRSEDGDRSSECYAEFHKAGAFREEAEACRAEAAVGPDGPTLAHMALAYCASGDRAAAERAVEEAEQFLNSKPRADYEIGSAAHDWLLVPSRGGSACPPKASSAVAEMVLDHLRRFVAAVPTGGCDGWPRGGAQERMGDCLARLGRWQEAAAAYQQAAQLRGEPADGEESEVYLSLGEAMWRAAIPAGAEAALRRPLESHFRSAIQWQYLAERYWLEAQYSPEPDLQVALRKASADAYRAAIKVAESGQDTSRSDKYWYLYTGLSESIAELAKHLEEPELREPERYAALWAENAEAEEATAEAAAAGGDVGSSAYGEHLHEAVSDWVCAGRPDKALDLCKRVLESGSITAEAAWGVARGAGGVAEDWSVDGHGAGYPEWRWQPLRGIALAADYATLSLHPARSTEEQVRQHLGALLRMKGDIAGCARELEALRALHSGAVYRFAESMDLPL